ncbi:MAG: heparinase II/III family protein [Clostridiales bacterium]|nr:heparinase II/III family protein [Clostridiales bacterium]
MKQQSTFYSGHEISLTEKKKNEIISNASFWLNMSFDQINNLMFSENLLRSWFVLSYGNCPDCGKPVLMYNWKIDIKNHPYKVQCPHCDKFFPDNDFEAYYKSGLTKDKRFSYELANNKLLTGDKYIDDGNGYVHDDGENYRFIAYYLTMGQWETNIIGGINALSLAYLVTKKQAYATRVAILLFSISKFHKYFDYYKQGLMYEQANKSNGYVCYWASASTDCKYMINSYDMVFDAIKNDDNLTNYLKLPFLEIQQQIEHELFQDILNNKKKIFSNPPSTDITILNTKITLNWPENKQEIMNGLDHIIKENTLVDGLPGEKGISGYASIGPSLLLDLFTQLSLLSEDFINEILTKYPILYKTYRFHIDSWYMNKYYPHCGDTGTFNMKSLSNVSIITKYQANAQKLVRYSPDWFAYQLYKHFGDIDFLKIIYINNGYSFDNLFEDDLFTKKSDKIQIITLVKKIILEHGTSTNQISTNYEKYRMAFLHSGQNQNKRMAFLLYDSGANHSHQEALNFGLFFKGKNIISGFGYPPVGYGGWFSNQVKWYRHPSSHNIVVIDNKEHVNLSKSETFLRYPEYGKTLLFESTDLYHVICAEAKEYVDADKSLRLLAMIDIDEQDSYIIDIYQTIGGNSHRKFQRSTFTNLETQELSLNPTQYEEYEFMRNFKTDNSPNSTFTVTFHDNETYFAYTDLSTNRKVSICESWVDLSRMKDHIGENNCLWLPTLMLETIGGQSTFVSVMEVYEKQSKISSIKRKGDNNNITLIITLINGKTDIINFSNNNQFTINRK